MSQQYIGEIRMYGAGVQPTGWFPCDGRTLKIADYRPLFSVIGGSFNSANNGLDTATEFQLPNLQRRFPLGLGTLEGENVIGAADGNGTITLNEAQLPSHTHTFNVLNEANSRAALLSAHSTTQSPSIKGKPSLIVGYTEEVVELFAPDPDSPGSLMPLSQNTIGPKGNGGAIDIMPPSLTVNFIIAYCGRYPKP